jgi:signal transduction histidine kinase
MSDSPDSKLALLERRLMRERMARKQAEQLLEERSRELFEANQSLNQAYAEMEKRVQERTLALKIARDEALSANKAKSEFLSSMSHELRTPLNAILGFSQLLKMDIEDPDQQENLNEIENAGQHLLNLINEVLDLAKIEAGAITLNIDNLQVDNLLLECYSLSMALAQRFAIKLEFNTKSGLNVYADALRFKQVVLNLVSNAIKYNNPKGSVHVDAVAKGPDFISIRVQDTGPGISAENQAHLFEPFNRMGAENSEIEGTGIGLMITRQLAEMMGGDIHLESEPGKGSTFIIDLPRQEVLAVKSSRTTNNKPHASPVKAAAAHQKLLYIEDDRANLRLVEKALGGLQGITLLTTMDPDSGVEQAIQEQPGLILLDINFPQGATGYKVLEKLRANESTKTIPVVAVTSDNSLNSVDQARLLGFDHFIGKPIDLDELHEIVEHYL